VAQDPPAGNVLPIASRLCAAHSIMFGSSHHMGVAADTFSTPMYGGLKGDDIRFVRRQRQRMNFVAVMQSVFVPWILFCLVFGVTSFYLHFSMPTLCWFLVGLASVFVLGIFAMAGPSFLAKVRHNDTLEPTWLIFLSITTLVAVVLGVVFGNMVYTDFMQRYYEYLNLNDYRSVDVSKMQGEQLMDGARMTFTKNTTLDLRKAMGFKNVNMYCVVPITVADANGTGVRSELANYDFWAVGLNCCSDDNTDFHCGEYNNPKARGALRLLETDDRPFYRLAVQQAEEVYHVKAAHPLFLYWTEDPVQEMESWREDGYKLFYVGMILHLLFQLLLVALGVLGFRKMGHY